MSTSRWIEGIGGMGQRRPHRREQVELLAHRRHHPGGIAARIGGMADRAHHPAVEFAQGSARSPAGSVLPCSSCPRLPIGSGRQSISSRSRAAAAFITLMHSGTTSRPMSSPSRIPIFKLTPPRRCRCRRRRASSSPFRRAASPWGRRARIAAGRTMPPRANASCISGTVIALTNACAASRRSRARTRGRRERRHPLRGANAGEADLREGGDVGMLRKPLLGRDGERAHAARLHHPDGIGDVEPRHMDVAVGEIADDLGAAAFERNVHEIEPGALGEDFGIDLLIAADAGAAVADLARDAPWHRRESRRRS